MTAPFLNTSRLVLGSAIVCTLLGGCNKHNDTSTAPATPAATPDATPATTPGTSGTSGTSGTGGGMTPDSTPPATPSGTAPGSTTNPDGTTTPPRRAARQQHHARYRHRHHHAAAPQQLTLPLRQRPCSGPPPWRKACKASTTESLPAEALRCTQPRRPRARPSHLPAPPASHFTSFHVPLTSL